MNTQSNQVCCFQTLDAVFPIDLFSDFRSVHVAERLALPISYHGVASSNPAGGEILPEPKRRFIAQSLSCSPFHHLEMTEILLKGHKTLTHPSIFSDFVKVVVYQFIFSFYASLV